MPTTRIYILVFAAAMLVLPNHLLAGSLANEFDISNNPGGGWTHGFNDTGVGGGNDFSNDVPFQLVNFGGNPGDRWTGDGTTDTGFPPNDLLSVNLGNGGTADHWGGGDITWDTGLSYHTWGDSAQAGGVNDLSGDDTIFSTFTVSSTGNYDITGIWTENGNSGGASVDVLLNGASIGSGSVDLDLAGDSTTIQSLGVTLSLGDTVSFRTLRDIDVTTGGSVQADFMVTPIVPLQLEAFINRQTGVATIENNTASPVSIVGYSVLSGSEALEASEWVSLADSDGNWLELSAVDSDLSEATLGTKALATPTVLNLGSIWRQGPNSEDIQVVVALANETVVTLPVEYTGSELNLGDLDFDGDIDTDDWTQFRMNQGVDMTGMNPFDAYELGDLDGDLDNDITDFRIFKDVFLAQPGASLSALTNSVPEPSSVVFVVIASVLVGYAKGDVRLCRK